MGSQSVGSVTCSTCSQQRLQNPDTVSLAASAWSVSKAIVDGDLSEESDNDDKEDDDLFQHCIECRCAEMQLTVEEEKQWKSKNSKVAELDLSSSSEEEEERNSDDVNFHSDSSKEEDEEGVW